MLFKKNVLPKWEDPQNTEGGSLMIQLDHLSENDIDQIWKDVVFSLVGGSFPHIENITGMRFMDRLKKFNQVKLELWLNVGLAKWKGNKDVSKKHMLIKDKITTSLKDLISNT